MFPGHNAEIIQLAAVSYSSDKAFNEFIRPVANINYYASKISGLQVHFHQGQRVITKNGNVVPCLDLKTGVAGQNIPGPEYTRGDFSLGLNIPRGYSSLGRFKPRGIDWASPKYTPLGQNIPPISI